MKNNPIFRCINIIIIVLVLFAVGTESTIYWGAQLLPWQSSSSVYRLIDYYSYFTVLSNLTVAVGCLLLLRNSQYDSLFFRIIRLNGLVSILITAIVYNIILRAIHHPPTQILQSTNECLHVVIPLLAILSWLCYGPYQRINRTIVMLSSIPLVMYGVYIFIRGYITSKYPYPFIDVMTLGYGKALLNVGLIFILFILLGLLFWWGDYVRCQRRKVAVR